MPYLGNGISKFTTADDLTVNGDAEVTGTVNPAGDTASGDAAAIGFTSAEGLILTGQGSTSDVTIKNDADSTVAFVPTGADDLRLPDNAELQFGDSADLKIYHNGSTSFIEDVGTGNFLITTNGNNIQLMKQQSEQMLVAKPDDAVELYYDNVKTLETTSTGIDIQGSAGATLKLTSTDTTGSDTELLGQIDFVSSDSSTGSAGTQARIKGVYEDNGDSSGIAFLAGASTGSGTPTISEVMRIRHEGNVGIGTAAPSTVLDCEGSGVPFSINSDNSNTYKIQLEDAGTVRSYLGASSTASFVVANSSVSEALRVASDGDLLVGKTSDTFATDGTALKSTGEVNFTRTDAVPISLRRSGTAGNLIEFYHDSSVVGAISGGNGDLRLGTGDVFLRFFDAGTAVIPRTAADATSNGVIDLGNSSNHFQNAYFTGTVFAEAFTGRADTDTSIQMAGSDQMKFFTGGSERMRVNASGHINIGQTSTNIPGQNNTQAGISFRSVGDGYFSRDNDLAVNANRNGGDGTCISIRRGGTQVGAISVTTSSTTYNTSSDARLKSNIQDAASASDRIDAIQVRQFDWNETGNHQDYGLVAQELQSIEPLAVVGSPDSEEMMGIDNSKLVPMLIKEIQSLRSRVAALESN